MKILYFTKYTRNGASSRMRSFQYFPFLESKGIRIRQSALFNEQYLEELYKGKGVSKLNILKCYLERFFLLFTVFKYDKIVIEKELFPYLPAVFEWLLAVFNIKYIVDYDDAIFHNYDKSSNSLIRFGLKNKIDHVMKKAYMVVAGNSYLADRAHAAGAKNVKIIPTVIDITRYQIKQYTNNEQLVVGWIGTRFTFEKHFMKLEQVIQNLVIAYPQLYFHIVGASDNKRFTKQVKFIPWSEVSEIEEILKFDVGLMPLKDSPWEKGKCAYKLIQYMACGIPGIASDVGANKDLINKQNGFLVETPTDFEKIIHGIIADREVLISKSPFALKTVREHYTLQKQQKVWLNILKCDK